MRAFTFVISAVLAGAGAMAALNATAPVAQTQIFTPSNCDAIPFAPLVTYNLNGGTLTGTLHTQLTVYNTGFATISRVNESVFPAPGVDADASTAYVSPRGAKRLLKELDAAGAFKLCDQPLGVADIPLSTLTVSTGRADARNHTFSYWIGSGEYGGVNTAIRGFIQSEFPGF